MISPILGRRAFLKALPALLPLAAATAQPQKTNIVFILGDDLGYGDVTCYNPESKIDTPNIDRLAKQGVTFTDAHSPAAVCTPTRYGFLTGRYSWRSRLKFGVLPSNSPHLIEAGRTTLPSLLKSTGYRTAIIGKWHLGLGTGDKWDLNGILEPGPLAAGFDTALILPSVFSEDPYCLIENGRMLGKLKPEPESRFFYQKEYKIRTTEGWSDENLGPTLTAKAVSYIEEQARIPNAKPFFLYFSASAPHDPNVPASFMKGKSKAGLRGDCVAEFDWSVGEIMKSLERSGVAQNTLLVVTSDNGPRPSGEDGETFGHASAGKLRGFKGDLWEGGHRVPFIARWPGKIAPASKSNQLLSLVDMTATFAAVAAVPLPETAGEDSFNLLPALLGSAREPIRPFDIHHSGSGLFSIRRGPWKLIPLSGTVGSRVAFLTSRPETAKNALEQRTRPSGSPIGELYNLDQDPAENKNLYNSMPDKVYEMLMLLEQCRRLNRTNNISVVG